MSCAPYHKERFSDRQNFFETPFTETRGRSLMRVVVQLLSVETRDEVRQRHTVCEPSRQREENADSDDKQKLT